MILWYLLFVAIGLTVIAFVLGIRVAWYVTRPLAALRAERDRATQAGLIEPAPFNLWQFRGLTVHLTINLRKPAPSLEERLSENLSRVYGLTVERKPGESLLLGGRRLRFTNINAPYPLDFSEVKVSVRPGAASGAAGAAVVCEMNFKGLEWIAWFVFGMAAIPLIILVSIRAPSPMIPMAAFFLLVFNLGFVWWRYAAQVISTVRFLDAELFACLGLPE